MIKKAKLKEALGRMEANLKETQWHLDRIETSAREVNDRKLEAELKQKSPFTESV